VELNVSDLERRLLNLQWQVERLWQMAEGNVQPLEQRLAATADQYAANLQQWAATAERHAQAVSQLEAYVREWKEAANRLQHDTSERLRELEATIEREWDALKKVHEQPVRELREQAATLTEVCLATASVAQQELDRHEARLATFQGDIHRRLSEFGRELQSAIAEIRARTEQVPVRHDATSPWSLDDVMRLHGQLRTSGAVVGSADVARALDQVGPMPPRALPPAIADRLDKIRRASEAPQLPERGRLAEDQPSAPAPRKWRAAVIGLGVAVIIAVGLGWQLRNEVQVAAQRAREAELESQRAAEDAAREAATAREQAVREIATARAMANRAERIGNVLAAPDLIRYSLSAAGAAPGASGQALWSRTRGVVFSASRIPPPPPNGAHQLWLLTRLDPVKAATFVPEPDGTVTLVEDPPIVPRAVVGVMVTAGSGDVILTSVSSIQ